MTIVEFLTARYDEAESGIREALKTEDYGVSQSDLDDIAAKRAIIEDYEDHVKTYRDEPTPAGEGIRFGLLLALARIAEGYADRPGYDVEWKP